MKIVNGREIAASIKIEIKEDLSKIESKHGLKPKVFTIVASENKESNLYLKLREKACKEVGIDVHHSILPEDTSEDRLIREIKRLNEDKDIHGIIVQFPLPKNVSPNKIIDAIDPKKDVEGLNPLNLGKTLAGIEDIVPCTPLAVLTILEKENIQLQGKDIVIINHSNIVGKPLATLFLNRNATVSVCHIYTRDLKSYTKNADIIVTATGKPGLIKGDIIREGAVLIDVGISKVGNTVKGDIDFESVKDKASIITPVPGGVGPVTIACSLKNILRLFKKSLNF